MALDKADGLLSDSDSDSDSPDDLDSLSLTEEDKETFASMWMDSEPSLSKKRTRPEDSTTPDGHSRDPKDFAL